MTNDREGNFTGSLPLTPIRHACLQRLRRHVRYALASPYANGVMLYDRGVRQSEIVDGLSHTIIIAEDTGRGDALDGEWADGENIFDSINGINRVQDNEIWADRDAGAAQVPMSTALRISLMTQSSPPLWSCCVPAE